MTSFLSRALTNHSFTFNLWFLYELRHKVRLFKTVCGIFHFRLHFVFIKVGLSSSKKKMFLFASMMMKNDKNDEKDDEKCFLFHVKALFVLKILRFLS